MNMILDNGTIQRWEREDEMVQAEMKDAAEVDAVALANSTDFTAHLRNEVAKLNLDDFKEDGDLAFPTKMVVEHPAFGDMLCDLLDKHSLLDMDAEYLSDAAEAYVTTFFDVLWRCLSEFENRRNKTR